jgi:hypothetical protein
MNNPDGASFSGLFFRIVTGRWSVAIDHCKLTGVNPIGETQKID